MLELRPNCECCDKDLPPSAEDAMICSFECTFCRDCAEHKTGRLVPQLRRQFSLSPDPSAVEAGKKPSLNFASF